MKTKLLTALLFLIVTSTQVLARPSIGAMNQKLDILISALVVCPSNAPTRFVDNGDGTICDRDTGLMWEMKDASDGTQDLANPRDVDNRYQWSSTGTAPDGRAFTTYLTRLNGEVAAGRNSEQLGGHSDWRLPTLQELQSILDCSYGSPCIDPIFGPTAADGYWSSTSQESQFINTNGLFDAWPVFFDNGAVYFDNKSGAKRARAVRGGR